MNYSFTIPGTLPGLNEIIAACRNNRYGAAKQKREVEARILPFLRTLPPLRRPVTLYITWYEPDHTQTGRGRKKRDRDNIRAGAKFIQDALVTAGKLPNDGWNEIKNIFDSYEASPWPGKVVVTIIEGGDQ